MAPAFAEIVETITDAFRGASPYLLTGYALLGLYILLQVVSLLDRNASSRRGLTNSSSTFSSTWLPQRPGRYSNQRRPTNT